MQFPSRFNTGVRNTTIPNPAILYAMDPSAETFQGLCSDYNFQRQCVNFSRLQAVLQRNGTDFLYVASAKYQGDLHINHRFVACAADGSLLWNKYVGFVARGGQNHVFVAGMRIKVSVFLELEDYQQDALLTNSKSRIEQAFMNSPRWKLNSINENDTLWN